MKKLFILPLIILVTAFNFIHAQGKQLREGKAIYSITMPKAGNPMMAGMIGDEQVIYFKDSSMRVEMKTMMGLITMISNGSPENTYTLMDMMGEKMAMKMSDVDLSAFTEGKDKPKSVITVTNQKKKIAGYKCTKATITVESKGEKVAGEIWYTKDIAAVKATGAGFLGMSNEMQGVEGFMMEFTMATKEGDMKMICKSIEKVKVDDKQFIIPDDYTIKNMGELMGGFK